MIEFKEFPKIEKYNLQCTITEKIHGTNACIVIDGDWIAAQSRTRFITPEDDNYGFAKWVFENASTLIEFFGDGHHFGEWYGLGINSGYGLKEKRFASFDVYLNEKPGRPDRVDFVPVMHKGDFSPLIAYNSMDILKEKGSFLVKDFMRPEGIVIDIYKGKRYKMVFEEETTEWRKGEAKEHIEIDWSEVIKFMQPIRLEKLLSREERYRLDYPKTLPEIAKEYVKDLEEMEEYLTSHDDLKKKVRQRVFHFIKSEIENIKAR